jgi:hypothetical protein
MFENKQNRSQLRNKEFQSAGKKSMLIPALPAITVSSADAACGGSHGRGL